MTISVEAWTADAGLTREVEDQFGRAIDAYKVHPDLISEHANHEESIRTGGYANRTLLELVQNAADALSGSPGDAGGSNSGRVEIVLDTENETLYCANAGRPFSSSGLTAITMAHLSGKRGDEIGRFGLGFKSVLAVTDSPQVFSKSMSFEFNSQFAREALASVGPRAKRYPVLRTATPLDAVDEFRRDKTLAELGEWATTIVKLPHSRNLQRLREEMESFSSEFLLFVHEVREVKLRILGTDPLTTTHTSRDLGNGVLRIEDPDGQGDEWLVQDRMHAPTPEARSQVGEAVSRELVKVTVAVPTRQSRLRIGEFWSYFPLQDRTSASGLFNAPWSVNDDRTTLLNNDYNREILRTLSEMFVNLMPHVRTADDPAIHLDYMPARGREILSFGDEILIAHIPLIAAETGLVPDAEGQLRHASELRPLDFSITLDARIHKAWSESPNTGPDVPSWRCYGTPARATRLRDMFIASTVRADMAGGVRDSKRAIESVPTRGLLSWLREWAKGDDPVSAADAFKVVCANSRLEGIDQAKVIPTTEGLRAVADRNVIFLTRDQDVELEGSAFVDEEFLKQPDVEGLLRTCGFRNLDPQAILNARIAKLNSESGDEEFTRLWEAVLDVPIQTAVKLLQAELSKIKVPTLRGGWAPPYLVFDVDDSIASAFPDRSLDRDRCLPDVTYQIGVVRQPAKDFLLDDEPLADDYRTSVLEALNAIRGPGERATERVELTPGQGPGPASMLFMLRDAGATEEARESWTSALLRQGDSEWVAEDLDTGRTYAAKSPVRWAVDAVGLLKTNRGFRSPADVVAPSLVKFEGLLPLLHGSSTVAAMLDLPKEIEDVPPHLLREALEADIFPPTISDATLVELILVAARRAYSENRPASIPARVGRAVEARSPSSVYLATNDEQEQFLSTRQRPRLRVSEDEATELVTTVGCRRFEDSFAFSMVIEGQQQSERIVDVFTGLRTSVAAGKVVNATVTRAALLVKQVTTEDGVEPQSMSYYLDGGNLIVSNSADAPTVLKYVNDAFDLGMNNADMSHVLRAGLDHHLEVLREEAKAASSDAARLEVYFGPDTLREALPKGLWGALATQGLVDNETSVAELFLTVYGADSVKFLSDAFIAEGFSDVPKAWTGGAATITWLRKMGFGTRFAGRRTEPQADEFVVPGAVKLNPLHDFQATISRHIREVVTAQEASGRRGKAMVELPTGAGKTRVATETVLQMFIDGELTGPVLWIAQSQELCEQAVQTWSDVWRGLGDERPLTIGRLWESNSVHQPDTEFSIVVATDAKLNVIHGSPEYDWLSQASLVIVDEGHRAGNSEMYTRILTWLGVAGRGWERPLLGLSATPFKGTSESATRALASRFGNHIIKAFEGDAYRELAQLGVLARVNHEVLPGVEVTLSSGEMEDARSLRRISPAVLERIGRDQVRMSILVKHIMSQDPDWPILVFTPNVLSAQVLAATLRYRGVEAESVSGQTGRQQRRDVIEKFKQGRIQVLANCDLLIQGFDAPGVRALYIARPTFSPNAYIQMAGRGLRGPANGGKDECLIVDMADDFGDMSTFLGYREYEPLWREQGS